LAKAGLSAALAKAGLAREARRITALLAIVVAIGLVHATVHESEAIWHDLLLRLYYIPILVSAYWYGAFGGLLVAVASSVAYAPHLRETASLEAGRYAEIVFFHVIGLTVGLLATAERRVTERHRRAAATLERANLELRRSYDQLQRADRLKTLGEVAAGLAHELRHPLASIRGALEIIEARSTPASPEAEFSRLAMGEVQRLDRLVSEFLRYARPHEPELRPTSVRDLVDRTVALLGLEADRGGVSLRVDRDIVLPPLALDPLQIEQVLLNVILNAIQASPPGRTVRVREWLDGDDVVVVDVVDEGPGMAADQLAQIFSPFFTTKETGTGLGLAIAQRIVLSHHGRLEAESAPDRGTRMRMRLPVRRTIAEPHLEPAAEARA
jgi:signal transduction histidine kinase